MTIYIYGLFDPRTPQTIVYVGQTGHLANRIQKHVKGQDRITRSWVNDISAQGFSIGHKVIDTTDEFNALTVESRYIADLKPTLNLRTVNTEFHFEISPIVSLADMEGKYIKWALDFFGGNKLATCKALGIGRQTLYNKLKAYGITQ